jgi:polysaccharide pyruvyl transferase WcaK-like protein
MTTDRARRTPRRKVALLNGYSAHNLGDALLLENAIRAIGRIRPGAEIMAMAADADSFHGRLGPARAVPAPIGFPKDMVRLPWAVVAIATRGRWGCSRLRALTCVEEAFSVGGGFLQFRRLREVITIGSVHVLQLAMCRRLRVPITMLPQSVGPFGGRATTRFGRTVIAWFRTLIVREQQSERYIASTAPDLLPRVRVAPDLGFLSESDPIRAPVGGPRLVGIVPRQWWFPGRTDPSAAYARYLDALAQVARSLVERGCSVDLIIQSNGPTHRGDDRIAARAINESLTRELPIVDLDPAESANDAIRRYGRYDLLIATRMHAAIMGLLAGTPTLAVAYEWKTHGVFETLGLSDWVIDIADIDERRLRRLVDRAAEFPAAEATSAMQRERERLLAALDGV